MDVWPFPLHPTDSWTARSYWGPPVALQGSVRPGRLGLLPLPHARTPRPPVPDCCLTGLPACPMPLTLVLAFLAKQTNDPPPSKKKKPNHSDTPLTANLPEPVSAALLDVTASQPPFPCSLLSYPPCLRLIRGILFQHPNVWCPQQP